MAESRVAVVLGGSGAIGSAVARRLAADGVTLVLGYLERSARARAVAATLEQAGSRVRLVEGNLADPATRQQLVEVVQDLGGRCDQLVHCVGVTSFKPLVEIRPNQWNLILEVSARSLVDVVAALLEPLVRARGAVVALSSQGATRWIPAYGALGPAKAALEASVRQLACELAPRGVRVNAVRAGLIDSGVVERLPQGVPAAVVARTPLARLGTPDEVAAVVRFLLGPDAAWMVGQVLEVDGGYCLT